MLTTSDIQEMVVSSLCGVGIEYYSITDRGNL